MKILTAWFISFLVMFIIGGMWNALIMENFYLSNSPEILRPAEDFNLGVIAIGYLILAGIMVLIVKQNFNENPRFVGGFMFGATFGLASTLPLYLILWGRWEFPLVYGLVDTGWHIVEQGVGSLVLCNIYYRKSKK